MIEHCDSHQFMSTIIDSVTLLLSGLASDNAVIEGANQFIIIMEFPSFFDLNLPYLVADTFKNLTVAARMELIEKMSYYEAEGMQRLLKVILN